MSNEYILIKNPLPFMNEKYIKSKLGNKYSSAKPNIILKNDLPHLIFISFDKKEISDSFLNEYNNKYFDDTIDYKLVIEKTEKTLNEFQNEVKNDLVPYNFEIPYENMWKIDYVNSPEKSGLLYINEEEKQKIYRTLKFLITKFGKNLFEGKSIMNISFPIFVYDKRTYLQVFAYEYKLAPYFLSRAAVSKDKLEKLKWITVHIVSTLHFTVIQTQPFNPLLGETFQCKIGDLIIYVESTNTSLLNFSFYAFDENKKYKIYGYQIGDIMTSPNSVTSPKIGKCYIEFNDGNKYLVKFPYVFLNGIAMGDRLFNYIDKIVILDLKNNLCSYIEMNPDELGFFKSFFSKKQTFPDHFKGKIVDSSFLDIDEKKHTYTLKKNHEELSKIEGEWTSGCSFDDVEYWDIEEYKPLPMNHFGFLCPSDSSLREDLKYLIDNDEEKSQVEKEKIENQEKKDMELREKCKKK